MISKNRLEAFTDGVLAIVITIMVLEIKVPHGAEWSVLLPLAGKFVSYVLSFLYVGIYWNNHHHTLHAAKSVDERVMWANMHFLFWLSLLPFSTGWLGENHFGQGPMILYGINLLLAAFAYYLLTLSLSAHHGKDSALAQALGQDWKGKISLLTYAIGIGASLIQPWLGFSCFAAVALLWLVPDRRMKAALIEGA